MIIKTFFLITGLLVATWHVAANAQQFPQTKTLSPITPLKKLQFQKLNPIQHGNAPARGSNLAPVRYAPIVRAGGAPRSRSSGYGGWGSDKTDVYRTNRYGGGGSYRNPFSR